MANWSLRSAGVLILTGISNFEALGVGKSRHEAPIVSLANDYSTSRTTNAQMRVANNALNN